MSDDLPTPFGEVNGCRKNRQLPPPNSCRWLSLSLIIIKIYIWRIPCGQYFSVTHTHTHTHVLLPYDKHLSTPAWLKSLTRTLSLRAAGVVRLPQVLLICWIFFDHCLMAKPLVFHKHECRLLSAWTLGVCSFPHSCYLCVCVFVPVVMSFRIRCIIVNSWQKISWL